MSIGLSIDLSSPIGTFCLFEESGSLNVLSEVTLPGTFSHSETLLAELDKELLKHSISFKDIETWVMGCGPGSFTGLRIAYSTIKAFSMASSGRVLTVEGPEARAFGFLSEIRPEKTPATIAVLSHLTSDKVSITSFDFEHSVLQKKSEVCFTNTPIEFDERVTVLSEDRIPKERLICSSSQLYFFPLRARHLRFSEKLKGCQQLLPEEVKMASPLYLGSSHFD